MLNFMCPALFNFIDSKLIQVMHFHIKNNSINDFFFIRRNISMKDVTGATLLVAGAEAIATATALMQL